MIMVDHPRMGAVMKSDCVRGRKWQQQHKMHLKHNGLTTPQKPANILITLPHQHPPNVKGASRCKGEPSGVNAREIRARRQTKTGMREDGTKNCPSSSSKPARAEVGRGKASLNERVWNKNDANQKEMCLDRLFILGGQGTSVAAP